MRWQNLIHKKCPVCDARLEENSGGFQCQQADAHDDGRRFAISKVRLVEILTDPDHAAVRHMNDHERVLLDKALKQMGIDDLRRFWRDRPKKDRIEPEGL